MKKIILLMLTLSLTFFAVSCTSKNDEKNSGEAEEVYTIWESTSAAINEIPVDFSETPMSMYLALFEDGIFQMSVSVDGNVLENYPQEGSYTFGDGIYTLDTGWVGRINEEKMELSFSDGEITLVFYCELQG